MPLYRYNPAHFKWPVTAAMLGILLALGVADMASGERLLRICAVRGIDVYYGEYWRVITGAFMHADIIHILVNCYALYALGRPGEQAFGGRTLLQVYVVALFGGNALALALQDPAIPLVGASGAIFGLFGLWLGFILGRTGSLGEAWTTPLGRQLLILLIINAVISVTVPRISLWGHLGGFVPGLALGYYHERRQSRRAGLAEHASIAVLLVVIAGLCVYASIPFNRAGYVAVQALEAYERDDLKAGDALLRKARNLPNPPQGATELINHLRAWRVIGKGRTSDEHKRALKWPLMGTEHGIIARDGQVLPYSFLPLTPELMEEEAELESEAKDA